MPPVEDADPEVDVIEAPLSIECAIDAPVEEEATETSAADVTVKVIGAVVQLNSDMGGFVPKGEFQYIVAQNVLVPSVLERPRFSQFICTCFQRCLVSVMKTKTKRTISSSTDPHDRYYRMR